MAETHNVFISWSGKRSRQVAEALRDWLPNVLQAARPWLSQNMEKGTRSLEEIAQALDSMSVGIIRLTPENLEATWILFEAGALSKTKDAESRVCTYLLCGLKREHIGAPLSIFQGTTADENDIRKLVWIELP
jgi:hypothetical protein